MDNIHFNATDVELGVLEINGEAVTTYKPKVCNLKLLALNRDWLAQHADEYYFGNYNNF